ncbi:MAG: efflux RND transporter periplasmic adaptor subunit [Rhodospirillales bacterium]
MKKIKTLLLCIIILVIGLLLARILISTAPKAERSQPQRHAILIETTSVALSDEHVMLELAGIVEPAEQVVLRTPVTGKIVSVNEQFIEGGLIPKGDLILQTDPANYELALKVTEATSAAAQFEHELELGRQDIARYEWELLKADDATHQEKSLALRIPHLNASKAAVASAKAKVQRAQLDLKRTTRRAPFNTLVRECYVDLGEQVNQQVPLALLTSTDRYHIEASVPIDRLKWLKFPGSPVTVRSTTGTTYPGEVLKLTGSIETKGRMARVIISVDDPLGQKTSHEKPLLLGEYVEVIIQGESLKAVTRIPRKALREGNKVWLDQDGALAIKPVNVVFRESDSILVRGLPAASELIISDIAAPVPGRPVNNGTRLDDRPLKTGEMNEG